MATAILVRVRAPQDSQHSPLPPAEMKCIRAAIAQLSACVPAPAHFRAFAWRRLRKVAQSPAPYPLEKRSLKEVRGEIAWLAVYAGLCSGGSTADQFDLLREYEALN